MLDDLTGHLGEMSRDRPVVTVCGSGYRLSIAASLLQVNGFGDVSSMEGAMSAWKRAKLTLVNNGSM